MRDQENCGYTDLGDKIWRMMDNEFDQTPRVGDFKADPAEFVL